MGKEQAISGMLSPDVLSRIGDYSLMARLAVEGFMSGMHKSVSRGHGGEFVQYRSYMPGDDLKYVDWKLYARQGKLYEKVYQDETDMHCAILVDSSASMEYQGTKAPCSKLRYGGMLAACFVHLARMQGDRPGLFVYSDKMEYATPASGRAPNLPELFGVLESLKASGTANHALGLARTDDYLGRRRGMVILISDLWEAEGRLEHIIRRIRFAGRDFIVCHVLDADEIELPFEDAFRFVDSENGDSITTAPAAIRDGYVEKMASHLSGMRSICLANQADYLLANTSAPIGDCLAAYLYRRGGMLK